MEPSDNSTASLTHDLTLTHKNTKDLKVSQHSQEKSVRNNDQKYHRTSPKETLVSHKDNSENPKIEKGANKGGALNGSERKVTHSHETVTQGAENDVTHGSVVSVAHDPGSGDPGSGATHGSESLSSDPMFITTKHHYSKRVSDRGILKHTVVHSPQRVYDTQYKQSSPLKSTKPNKADLEKTKSASTSHKKDAKIGNHSFHIFLNFLYHHR